MPAMRRKLFLAFGGFDERFFVYLEDLDLSNEELLFVGVKLVPFLDEILWPRGQLGILRKDAKPLLIFKDRFRRVRSTSVGLLGQFCGEAGIPLVGTLAFAQCIESIQTVV